MKKILIVLGLTLLVATSGCMRSGMMAGGRGSMTSGGSYGSSGYGSPTGYGSGGPMGSGYGSGPMVGTPGFTPGALPVGARGRIMAHGGSVYYGTGYTNPELTFMAGARRAELATAAAAVPSVPMASSPCVDGRCPTGTVEAVDSEARRRLDMVEDNLVLSSPTD